MKKQISLNENKELLTFIFMGRTPGSPNVEVRWNFIIKNPCDQSVIFTKNYVSVKAMHDDLKNCFSKAQLSSYASKSRSCPKLIEIHRISQDDEENSSENKLHC